MVETANSRSTDKLPQADDHSIHDMELIERAMPLGFRQEGTNHTTTRANNKGRSAAATTGAWQCSGRQLEGGGNSAISCAMQGYSSRLGVASRNDISICFSACFNFLSVQLNFCNLYILCYLLLKRQSTCLFLLEIKRQENLIYIILYLAAIREMYLLFNNIWKHYFLCIFCNYFVFQTRRDVVYHISRKNKGKETHTTHTNTRHTYKSTPWKHRSLVLTQNTRPLPGKYPTKQLAVAGQPGKYPTKQIPH